MVSLIPVAWSSHRNQSQMGCITSSSRAPVRLSLPRQSESRGRGTQSFVLRLHLLGERRGLDAPLGLQLADEAGLVPIRPRLGDELPARLLALLDRDAPGHYQDQ